MDQVKIGEFIALKRKEHNLTQEELAQQLQVSNKSVSKWECGKCMPDLGIQLPLCEILEVSLNELLAGEACSKEVTITQLSDRNLLELLSIFEKLKSQKDVFIGILLIVVGRIVPMSDLQNETSGTIEFIYGISIGLSVGLTLLGVCWMILGLCKEAPFTKAKK